MSTEARQAEFAGEQMSESDAIIAHVLAGKPLDPELYKRLRDRGQRITDEIRQEQGVLEIAVELIRQTRDEG